MSKANNQKPKILVIGGATASGKSALSLALAKEFGGEIIGADSMQIYKGLDIGTGKILPHQRQEISHHMIDIIDPWQSYSAGQYCKDAGKAIKQILERGRLPIVVGGTGLYINALLNNYNFGGVQSDYTYRDTLKKQAQLYGAEFLHKMLAEIDEQSANKIPPTDEKRLVRALEICHLGGGTKSGLESSGECGYDYLMLIAGRERPQLYSRIESRVDEMLSDGLVDEVQSLNPDSDWQSMKAIGYKETLQYLRGEIDQTQLAELIKKNTRHYAKRQITYFKNIFSDAVWMNADDCAAIAKRVSDFLDE